MLIELFSGKETFRSGTCQVAIFVKKTAEDKETAMHNAERDRAFRITKMKSEFIPASPYNRNFGQWYETTYDVPEGMYIKVWVQRRFRGRMGYNNSQVLLRARPDAAYRRVRVELTGEGSLAAGYISGRFDIVPLEMFKKLGIPDSPYNEYYAPEFIEDTIEVEILEPEIRAYKLPTVKKIVTETGKTVQVRIRNKRRIKIRK